VFPEREIMGTKYNFVCPGCGYTAERVSGGRDLGEMAVVRTMICETCEVVVDVLIGRYGEDGPTGDPDYDKNLNLCPECKGTRLLYWPIEHPCPKCHAKMSKDETCGKMLWD
jgi:Zn finger protein HypA/HybF involved in hydrogenase expression